MIVCICIYSINSFESYNVMLHAAVYCINILHFLKVNFTTFLYDNLLQGFFDRTCGTCGCWGV